MTYFDEAEDYAKDRMDIILKINKIQDITVRDFLEIQAIICAAYEHGYRHGVVKLHGDIV